MPVPRLGVQRLRSVCGAAGRGPGLGVRSVVVTTAAAPQQYIDFHMPNINQVRTLDDLPGTLFWRVPIDDERCISFPVGVIPPTGAGAGVSRRQLPDDDLDSGSEW